MIKENVRIALRDARIARGRNRFNISGSICDSCLPYYLLQEDKTCKENPSMPAPENSEATETPTTVGATVGSVVAVAGTTIALVMGFKG